MSNFSISSYSDLLGFTWKQILQCLPSAEARRRFSLFRLQKIYDHKIVLTTDQEYLIPPAMTRLEDLAIALSSLGYRDIQSVEFNVVTRITVPRSKVTL